MDIFILDIGKTWALTLFRQIFAFIDYLIYSVISILFKTMFQLANFELVGFYDEILKRVYVILGIFMLFKVTISLITYLVNPDKINDKEQGVSKIVTRIITVLVMLILLPNAFSLLTEFQNKALPVVPKIIIGTAFQNDDDAITNAGKVADVMTTTMINGFAHAKTEECGVPEFDSLDSFLAGVNESCKTSTGKTIYAYDYIPVISTAVGLVMCYVIVSLNISVAIRAFKLIILRMIAPIPVVSYIDPKSSKDGTFHTWLKTFISTWAELFIFVGLIYFIIYILDYLLSGDAWMGFFNGVSFTGQYGYMEGVLFLAFIVVGLLFFARQAPKFVMDALGIKSKGNFMRMLGMGATAAGIAGSTASSLKTRNEYDRVNNENGEVHHLRNLGASLLSGLASGEAGGNALLTTDKPNLRTGIDAQSKYNAQNLNRIQSGSTFGGRLLSIGSGVTLGQTPAETMRKRNTELEEANKALKDYKSTIESRFDGNDEFMYKLKNGQAINWLEFDKNFSAANNGDEQAIQWFMSKGFVTDITEEIEEMEEYKVQVGTKSVWVEDSGEYVEVPQFETRTRPVTKTVTRQTADLGRVRAEYEQIHKDGYAAFEDAVINKKTDASGKTVEDSVVYGKLIETKDKLKGVVVDKYKKSGEKDENAAPVDLSQFNGGYGNTKGALGDVSGTQREYVRDPKYKAAMADEKESKK